MLLDYPVSYVELVGVLSGLISVYFAARSNILTWPIGLLNVFCFFLIFYQVQLYSDMLLQVYFFVTSVYGWVWWSRQNKQVENPIKTLTQSQRIQLVLVTVIATIFLGAVIARIHFYLPDIFKKPSSYPYIDTFIAVMSIIATLLLARRVLETWLLWIMVDVLSVGLFATKNVMLISIEYFVFLCIAAFGLYNWMKLLKDEKRTGTG